MRYDLTIDTESSGFRENRLVQLSFELSAEGQVIHEATLLVKPDGWTIEEGATKVHSITQEYAAAHGLPLRTVLTILDAVLMCQPCIVAHNIAYDVGRVLIPEFQAVGIYFAPLANFCTMEAMRHICQLPMVRGSGWKAPKLEEAYRHAFGEELTGNHRADVDRKACARLLQWIRGNDPANVVPAVPAVPDEIPGMTPEPALQPS